MTYTGNQKIKLPNLCSDRFFHCLWLVLMVWSNIEGGNTAIDRPTTGEHAILRSCGSIAKHPFHEKMHQIAGFIITLSHMIGCILA